MAGREAEEAEFSRKLPPSRQHVAQNLPVVDAQPACHRTPVAHLAPDPDISSPTQDPDV